MYKNALKEDLIRVVEDLDGTVESTDTIAKLKTKIENSSTFESDPDFVKTLIQNCIDERVSRNEREVTLEKQKIELAKLQLAKLEKEIELQTAKNKALSLNPAAKVEEKQFETNIENMITSIKTLSLPVPTRSENFNLFFQSLERAFLTKKINDEYKSEILINLLGERAHNVLLYIKEEELNDYEKLKSIETATHIGIREAEDWFRPIDLAKECDIYISSRSGSHKEIPITYGYTQDPFKNRSQNFKPKIKENYPQYLERENKNCYICGDSSHYARDCEKRFKSKESNSHIHNKINVNTLKVESEKQNSVLCKKVNGAMKTSSVNFNAPSPMESNHRRFALLRKIFQPWQWKRRKRRNRFEQTSRTLQRKISMRSTNDQLVKKRSYACETQCFPVEPSGYSPMVSMEKEKREVPLRTAYSQAGRCGMQPKAKHSLRAQLSETKTETMRTETVETFELVKVEPKL
ncbi:integrase catalytic domain-containing protein [Trichonephila clavipes]|nr:integrase catalytic domain-containing protein [Trichonephila clavipes]